MAFAFAERSSFLGEPRQPDYANVVEDSSSAKNASVVVFPSFPALMQTAGLHSNRPWLCRKHTALATLSIKLSSARSGICRTKAQGRTEATNTETVRFGCRLSAAASDSNAPRQPQKAEMAGSFPNLGWNAIGMEELRDLPVFGALPPVWNVPLVNPQSYRCAVNMPVL